MILTYKDRCRFENFFWPGKEDDCWNWLGAIQSKGYGHFVLNKQIVLVHRIAYFLQYGQFDENLFVLHTCDNRSCVNPKHLFLGTNQDNIDDMVIKKRNKFGKNHYKANYSDLEVLEIVRLYRSGNYTQEEFGEKYNISQSTICRWVHGNRKSK